MHILKEVCYMTTSFPGIRFFHENLIISRERLIRFIFQRDCVYFTALVAIIHYNKRKRSVIDSTKIIVCLFEENHCSPALLKVAIYSTELVTLIFV